jgi:acetyl-CoA acetyltransferase
MFRSHRLPQRGSVDRQLSQASRLPQQRDGLKRGIVTLCIGGGQGIALAIPQKT